MTSPFTFPDVTPRTTPQRNDLDDFAQLLLGVHKMRQDFAVQSEQLALERRRVEESEETGATNRKRANAELDDRQAEIDAREIATRYLPLVLAPGGATLENLATQRVRLLEEAGKDKKRNLGVRALAAFDQAVADAEKARGAMANRRAGEIAANVAEKTEAAQITAGNLADDIATTQLGIAQVQKRLEDMRVEGFDAARINSAFAGMDRGLTVGEAFRVAGLPLRDLDPNLRAPTTGGKGDDVTERFSSVLEVANAQLDELGNKGLNFFAYSNLVFANPVVDWLTGAAMSEEQKALAQAFNMFMQPYNRVVAGGNASDIDLANTRRTFITRSTDGEKVRKQKELMRHMLPAILRSTEGQLRSERVKAIIDNARSQKVDEALLRPFVVVYNKELAAEQRVKSRAGSTHKPASATTSDNAALLRANGIGVRARP